MSPRKPLAGKLYWPQVRINPVVWSNHWTNASSQGKQGRWFVMHCPLKCVLLTREPNMPCLCTVWVQGAKGSCVCYQKDSPSRTWWPHGDPWPPRIFLSGFQSRSSLLQVRFFSRESQLLLGMDSHRIQFFRPTKLMRTSLCLVFPPTACTMTLWHREVEINFRATVLVTADPGLQGVQGNAATRPNKHSQVMTIKCSMLRLGTLADIGAEEVRAQLTMKTGKCTMHLLLWRPPKLPLLLVQQLHPIWLWESPLFIKSTGVRKSMP